MPFPRTEHPVTFERGLWLIACAGGHEWVAAPDTDEFFSCPTCGAEEQDVWGVGEQPDHTTLGVIA